MDLRDLIAETLAGHRVLTFPDTVVCLCGKESWSFDPISSIMEAQAGYERHVADVLLAALGERVLPEGGETRDHAGYWNPVTREVQTWWSYSEMGHKAPDRARTITTWPDGAVFTGRWRPVDTEETPGGGS